MEALRSHSRTRRDRLIVTRRVIIFLPLLITLVSPAAWAASANEAAPSIERAEPETFGTNTPLGRLSYQAGRGVRVGKTGLVVGGFTTAEVERLEEGDSRGGLEELSFLVSLKPIPFVHLFTELGLGPLMELERGRKGVHSDPQFEVDRLYLDLEARDALNLRFGKFLTPIGRWNLAPIEPLVWTTSEPVIVDEVFDETMTGAMLHGVGFPLDGALSYSLYGTFLNPLDPDADAPPAKRSTGAHLEWASLRGWSVGASYWASQRRNGEWNHLGGADLLWQPHARVEVSGETVFGEGSREDGVLWGLYAQTVVEMVRTLYLVGRYERFDPPGVKRAVNLFDLGLVWEPVPYLRLKADYLIADHLNEFSEPGFRMSLSLLF